MSIGRSSIAALAVCRGAILHREFQGIEHSKFFVVIGENGDRWVGFFFINSNIAPSIQQKPDFLNMQMPIKSCDYEFLNHSSFIGAQEFMTIKKDLLIDEIANGITAIKGDLTESDLELLMQTTRESALFSKFEKDTFLK